MRRIIRAWLRWWGLDDDPASGTPVERGRTGVDAKDFRLLTYR